MNAVPMIRATLLAACFVAAAAYAAPPPTAPPAAKPDAAAAAKPAAAGAKAPAKTGNDVCYECHDKMEPKPGKAPSVHEQQKGKCTDCHADANADHDVPLKPVNCGAAGCHEKAAKEYAGTVHGSARKGGNALAASCVDCHGNHDITRVKDAASPVSHLNVEATCSKCHGNDKFLAKGKLPGGNVGGKFHDSIHGKALKGAAQASAPTCNNCHGSHNIRPKSDKESRTSKLRIPETCGSCHKPESAAFLGGKHGKLNQEGDTSGPSCTDCHSAHGIQMHEADKFQTGVIEECGACLLDYLKTYRDTFHGQVTALGYARMATCASCHGAHDVRPASDPKSMVSKENRLKTCQACHPGAAANFASFDPHANKHDKARDPSYYWSARFMELLLLGVFSFFGIHTVLWFFRELVEKFSRGKGKERH